MLKIYSSISEGSGTTPKEIDIDSTVMLYTDSSGEMFEWEVLSQPEETTSVIVNPVSYKTRFGPLDKNGVYVLQLWVDRNLHTQKTKTIALSVPATISVYNPHTLKTEYHGRVKNGGFEIEGIADGLALFWDIIDTAGVLSYPYAGISRGRIEPANFTPTEQYSMCLGDDQGIDDPAFLVGDEFSISQEIDFTNTKQLTLRFKYTKS